MKQLDIVRYGGEEWLLSNWDYTYGKKLSQRIWICPKGRVYAVVIVRTRERKYNFIVQCPMGEILDVGVCKTRHEAKIISTKVLKQFLSHCRISFPKSNQRFKKWIL